MHGACLSTATFTNYYVTDYCTRRSVMDTIFSSSVLPLCLLESVVRYSLTVLYTLDMISRYFYAGLDYCSQIRHTRWILLLLSDTSYPPDIATTHGFILPNMDYISLVEFVGAVSNRQQVTDQNSRLSIHCFLAHGVC